MQYEYDSKTKYIVSGSLFVTAPAVFIIDLITLYKIITGYFDLSTLSVKGKIGLFIFFVLAPLYFGYCYKTAHQQGWIGNKN